MPRLELHGVLARRAAAAHTDFRVLPLAAISPTARPYKAQTERRLALSAYKTETQVQRPIICLR
jgi:hypothetical protein